MYFNVLRKKYEGEKKFVVVHIPDVSCRWFTNIGEIVQSSVIRKTWNEGTMEYW